MNECSEILKKKKKHNNYSTMHCCPTAALAYSTRVTRLDMKDQDDHVFSQDDHYFGDGRPGDHHEILLKLWPCFKGVPI